MIGNSAAKTRLAAGRVDVVADTSDIDLRKLQIRRHSVTPCIARR
jgi:hypothetical protein